MIFDNATAPEHLIDYLPQNQSGHVLITSRHKDWSAIVSSISVPLLAREESIDFLIKRAGQGERSVADALADELGDLPLALEHAGAYIRRVQGTSMAKYLELFRTRRREVMKRDKAPIGYEGTVATTWDVSFQEIEQESPAGASLLSLCAFLGPDDIPRDVVCAGAEHLPSEFSEIVTDALALDDAVASLLHYSLIEADENGWSVHRLVQAVVRDRMSEDEQKRWAEVAVQIVNDAFPSNSNDVRNWPVCAPLLSHALAAAEQSEALQVAPDATGRLLNESGIYLRNRAQFVEARSCYDRALKIGEASYGPDHSQVAIYANNLGGVLEAFGDLEGAKAHYERALRIDEANYGPDHPQVAICANNLGGVLRALGDLKGAKAHYERALETFRKFLGDDHPNTKIVQRNLDSLKK